MRNIVFSISLCLSVACMATAQTSGGTQKPDRTIPIPNQLFTTPPTYYYRLYAITSDTASIKDGKYLYGQTGHGGNKIEDVIKSFNKDNENIKDSGITFSRSDVARFEILIPLDPKSGIWKNDSLTLNLAYESSTIPTDPDHDNLYIVRLVKESSEVPTSPEESQVTDTTVNVPVTMQDLNASIQKGFTWSLILIGMLLAFVILMLWLISRSKKELKATDKDDRVDNDVDVLSDISKDSESKRMAEMKNEIAKIQKSVNSLMNDTKANLLEINKSITSLRDTIPQTVKVSTSDEAPTIQKKQKDTPKPETRITNVELSGSKLVITDNPPQYDCFCLISRNGEYTFELSSSDWGREITLISSNMKEAIDIVNPFTEKYTKAEVIKAGRLTPISSTEFRIDSKLQLRLV